MGSVRRAAVAHRCLHSVQHLQYRHCCSQKYHPHHHPQQPERLRCKCGRRCRPRRRTARHRFHRFHRHHRLRVPPRYPAVPGLRCPEWRQLHMHVQRSGAMFSTAYLPGRPAHNCLAVRNRRDRRILARRSLPRHAQMSRQYRRRYPASQVHLRNRGFVYASAVSLSAAYLRQKIYPARRSRLRFRWACSHARA